MSSQDNEQSSQQYEIPNQSSQPSSSLTTGITYPGQSVHRIKARESRCSNMRSKWTKGDEEGFRLTFGRGTLPPPPGMAQASETYVSGGQPSSDQGPVVAESSLTENVEQQPGSIATKGGREEVKDGNVTGSKTSVGHTRSGQCLV